MRPRNQRVSEMSSGAESDKSVLPVHAEQAEVSRAKITTGVVTVSTVTSIKEEIVDLRLTDETVRIERVECNRFVDNVPEVRKLDNVTIVPVLEERLIVERRLFLKEEVHIHRITSSRQHRQTVMLREQSAVITNEPVLDGETQ